MSKKGAVPYAEDDLGVNTVYETAQMAARSYALAKEKATDLRRTKRRMENTIADREADVAAEIFATGGGASVSAIERHIKISVGTDDVIRTIRAELLRVNGDIDQEETAAALAKVQIEIHTARMTELGGYLLYLAEAKRAAKTTVVNASPVVRNRDTEKLRH